MAKKSTTHSTSTTGGSAETDPEGAAVANMDEPIEIGWAEAMEEIEDIVASLEDDGADVDTLSERIERASLLIAACRRRLRTTQLRVYELIEQLDDDPADAESEE